MIKPKIYIETSVLNFVFADDSPDKKEVTKKLFKEIKEGRYLPFTSDYVTEEIDKAPEEKRDILRNIITEYNVILLQYANEIEELAEVYVKEGIIPWKHRVDALHIATATVNDLDIIISWNFEHIVKRKTIMMTELINLQKGYKKVEIYSPLEVIGHGI